jgi:hypothetical protein
LSGLHEYVIDAHEFQLYRTPQTNYIRVRVLAKDARDALTLVRFFMQNKFGRNTKQFRKWTLERIRPVESTAVPEGVFIPERTEYVA